MYNKDRIETERLCICLLSTNKLSYFIRMSNTPKDILRLFREDLNPEDRVNAFQSAAEQLHDQVTVLASPERVITINARYHLLFVFNAHGNSINAAQSIEAGGSPFISFVENAGDAEIADSKLFGYSVGNAFDMQFNVQPPRMPFYLPPQPREDFGYWRDRGLLARSSLIAPVDIRHYSRRLLDALMGNDYDQQFLNRSIPGRELRQKELGQLLEEQGQKGRLVMYSNAVRELTSTKQVLETLEQIDAVEEGSSSFGTENSDKVRALAQRARINTDDGRLPVNIVYGTGHHTMVHIYRNLGIEALRVFAGKADVLGHLSYSGTVLDQFFSSHPFGITDEKVAKYSAQLVLEGMLWEPIDNAVEHGIIPKDRANFMAAWITVMKTARRQDLIDRLADIHAEFRTNPLSTLPILEAAGLEFIRI
ncbi:hypothetical protein IPL68_06220 [Candidatus Saccharibacteria bacterium]|nr:MAG: hypothetical protein IPL68_06220 [Candidatus Saccharibacteria bacterium]